MASKLSGIAKRIVGYPENPIPVISSTDWIASGFSNPKGAALQYLQSLFPILSWITRYNTSWLTGDVIAGFTVGVVLVPQAMSYAQLASLPPEFGLYSSFFGVLTYCLFATSKDVSIGPVAVMSLTVAQIIRNVGESHPGEYTGPEVAITLSFICGFLVLAMGLLRLGWIIEFIPAPAVSGFMTGSAITIVTTQLPGLLGISDFDTRESAYLVIINSLKGIPRASLDAAFGITGLVSLYIIRFTCEWLSKRYPRRARIFFFINVCRNALIIVILTIAAWLYCRPRRDEDGNYPIRILEEVPAGLKRIGQPDIDSKLISTIAPELPVATIILLLEHIAIAKSFGRLNGYTINPNQELIAIGVANTCGACFGAYPVTGSFSRSALTSKSGARTPLGGVVTAAVIIVALYGLTPAFFWIPTAGLSAVIIHAVADLVASPSQVYGFWRISPFEFFIWAGAVLITVFSSIEYGIYASIIASLIFLLVRLAIPRGKFLGRVAVHGKHDKEEASRDVFVPLKSDGNCHPDIKVLPPAPGVVIYRFEESFIYPNASLTNSIIVSYVRKNFRKGQYLTSVKLQDRPWNDPGPPRGVSPEEVAQENDKKSDLRAVVLDFSAIPHVDITSIQLLIDTRNEIERWVDHSVEFHFASILSPWIRRALIAGGFGVGDPHAGFHHEVAQVVPLSDKYTSPTTHHPLDEEQGTIREVQKKEVLSDATPFFHIDLQAAVRAAERGADGISMNSMEQLPANKDDKPQ